MKAYGLWHTDYNSWPWFSSLINVYKSRTKAEKELNRLNSTLKDDQKIQIDDYGPIAGEEYKIRELEIIE